jgi:transcription initiation factor IIF auxiliary subunit
MYYGGNGNGGQSNGGGVSYYDGWNGQNRNTPIRDSREGRSGETRRMYMEHKSLHADKTTKMKDLEKYMQELTHDMTEMIEDASPEEKQLLQQKISTLAQKIV